MSWELTDAITNHDCTYDGDWSQLFCKRCRKRFTIGADMCDSEGITKELKRINRRLCSNVKR